MSDTTLRAGSWAVVRLRPDCPGDGRRAHDPAEDGARVRVSVVGQDGDHSMVGLYNGRAWTTSPQPPGGLGIGRCFRPDELQPIPGPP